jgi:hypothetical protein
LCFELPNQVLLIARERRVAELQKVDIMLKSLDAACVWLSAACPALSLIAAGGEAGGGVREAGERGV